MPGINYVICAAGSGTRFRDNGLDIPKPLIKIHDRTLLERSLDSIQIQADDTLIIVTQRGDKIRENLEQTIQAQYFFTKVSWVELDHVTGGQLETALESKDKWNIDSSLVIFNCDTFFQSKTLEQKQQSDKLDGIIPCAIALGDAWSFCRVEKENRVVKVKEKVRISKWATVGYYYFRNTKKFLHYASRYLRDFDTTESYVAPLYNSIIEDGGAVEIDRVSLFKPMGTPNQVEDYWQLDFQSLVAENMQSTLVIDLDNTITIDEQGVDYANKKPNEPVIRKLQEYHSRGFKIIILTARRMRTHKNDEAGVIAEIAQTTIEWLKQHGVPFDGLRFGKPFAQCGFYVDDKAVRPKEFLSLSVDELIKLTLEG